MSMYSSSTMITIVTSRAKIKSRPTENAYGWWWLCIGLFEWMHTKKNHLVKKAPSWIMQTDWKIIHMKEHSSQWMAGYCFCTFENHFEYYLYIFLKWNIHWTLKSWFYESRFNEIPRFSIQIPASLNYFAVVNSIRFSELHDLVNKSGLTGWFVKSRLGCTLCRYTDEK